MLCYESLSTRDKGLEEVDSKKITRARITYFLRNLPGQVPERIAATMRRATSGFSVFGART